MSVVLDYCSPGEVLPRHRDWEVYTPKQIELARRSLRERGALQPPLVDAENRVVCGALFVRAAQLEQLNRIQVLRAPEVSDADLRFYAVSLARLTKDSSFDEELLGMEVRELRELLGDPDLSALGFEAAELDRLLALTKAELAVADDILPASACGPAISQLGDCWLVGPHKLP
jgi:ParB-like chromosome segregation protein Spo0J